MNNHPDNIGDCQSPSAKKMLDEMGCSENHHKYIDKCPYCHQRKKEKEIKQTKIGLCMIVKNEAHVITRCLDSVKPLIDFFLIVDTGSTDGTVEIIYQWMHNNGILGAVVNHDWVDFSSNRTKILDAMRTTKEIDYVFMIDADEVLEFPDFENSIMGKQSIIGNQYRDAFIKSFKASLTDDLYMVPMQCGVSSYSRPQLFRNDKPYYFKGVLHEYLECKEPILTRGVANGLKINAIQDGARANDADKYIKDAKVLADALKTETDPYLKMRYRFYLAQCCRDAGFKEQAIDHYQLRADMGGWKEEVFYSLYQMAVLREQIGHDCDYVIRLYMNAFEYDPSRADALHGAVRICLHHKKYQQAYMLAKHALTLPIPKDGLFVETWIYDYGMLDEFSIAAYWAGHYGESLMASQRILAEEKYPIHEEERLLKNRDFAIAKIQEQMGK